MKKLLLFVLLFKAMWGAAQVPSQNCVFKNPYITMHFGSGRVQDVNTTAPAHYNRTNTTCPPDGYYTYTPYTSDCFSGDWHTITEDHTPGDAAGNMLLVNASWVSGPFLNTTLTGLKANTIYEFGVWLMNVCRISDKCPFPLLPNITIRLQTPEGKTVAQFNTGDVPRLPAPHWTQYRAVFLTPPAPMPLIVTMQDTHPGGCGNDFALDDITLRECLKPTPSITTKTKPPVKIPAAEKPIVKKAVAPPPVVRQKQIPPVSKRVADSPAVARPMPEKKQVTLPPPPAVLLARQNPLVKQIVTEPADIKIDLYDNGEIDGDTVTIYHNNTLLVAAARLSQNPISFHILVDAAQPHHELVMVANNLGSIPPNTSLMIVTAGNKRYQVFISSTEQKNAKVVIDLAQ